MSTKYEQSRRAETNRVVTVEPLGEDVDNDDDNDIEGKSDNLLLCYHYYYYYST